MERIRRLLAPVAVLLSLNPLLVSNVGADIDAVMQAQIHIAVARGLDWIGQHPASLQDGGLPDLLDEGVGFLVLSTLSADPGARERFTDRFRERMTALGELPEFAQWARTSQKRLTDYYHLVLAAHLMQQAGSPSDLQPVIVASAQRVLAATPYSDPTKRLTIALFLMQLGAEPGISIDAALDASRIEHIARGNSPTLPAVSANPQYRLAASLYLYALIHEIIALTDFGRQPPPVWLESRLEPLNRFLVEAITWAGDIGNIDLLSELLLAARFLDAPLQEILPGVVQQLLDGQQADGSWGSYETRRPNRVRHAVFTATTALWSYAGAAPGKGGQ